MARTKEQRACPSCDFCARVPEELENCPDCGAKFSGSNVIPDAGALARTIKRVVNEALDEREERAPKTEKSWFDS